MYRNLMTFGCAAVLALGLAACGGGGGDDTADAPTTMEPTGPTPAEQITELQTQINELRAELGLDPIDIDELTGSVADLTQELNTLKKQAADAKAIADAKANSATAKALKAAIDIAKVGADGSTAVPDTGTGAITPTSIPVLDADGAVSAVEADETDTVAITLKKGDAVGSLGNWKGTDYAGMEAPTGAAAKNTGMVRVYANQGAAKSVTFASEAGGVIHGWSAVSGDPPGDYTVVTTAAAQQKAVGGFPTTGTTSYDDQKVTGTFMGASGTYECAATCTATVTADGVDLGTGWTFTPGPGATLQQPDARYLQFGWWVRKDKDGPTHAGAFYGVVTPTTTPLAASTIINSAALVGKATYAGSAAGKFAISDPLRPADDNAGHFTADAELMADFKATVLFRTLFDCGLVGLFRSIGTVISRTVRLLPEVEGGVGRPQPFPRLIVIAAEVSSRSPRRGHGPIAGRIAVAGV